MVKTSNTSSRWNQFHWLWSQFYWLWSRLQSLNWVVSGFEFHWHLHMYPRAVKYCKILDLGPKVIQPGFCWSLWKKPHKIETAGQHTISDVLVNCLVLFELLPHHMTFISIRLNEVTYFLEISKKAFFAEFLMQRCDQYLELKDKIQLTF